VSDTEERPAAMPEEIGTPDPDSLDHEALDHEALDHEALADGGPGEPGLGEAGPGEAGPGEAGPGEAGPGEAGPGQGTPGQGAPGDAGLGGVAPADGALVGPAGADGAPADRAAAGDAEHRRARRRMVVGWTAATIGIVGVAWLLTSLITLWTSYATLTVAKWQMLTYGPRSARISFSVHNSGTGAAAGCIAHVQLGDGQVVSASSHSINVGGTEQVYLGYWEKQRPQTHPAYAWATCGRARSPYERVATTADIGLITSHVTVMPGPAVTILSFEEHNLGSQEAYSCRAVTRFRDRSPVAYGNAPSDIRSGATGTFTIGYPSSLGHPVVVYAQCYDPPASDGVVVSTKVYLR